MTLTLARSGSDWIMKDGKFATNCNCCDTVSTPCNPTAVPRELPFTLTFLCVQLTLTLTYSPTAKGGVSPGWAYVGDDVAICGDIEFRDFVLWCDGGSWAAEFTYTNNGTQDVVNTISGMTSVVVVSTDPLCVTTTAPGFSFTGCGSGDFYFAIGDCDVVSVCPDWSSMPTTATLTYSIGSLPPATMNLDKVTDKYFKFETICDLGDGTVVARFATIRCEVAVCVWRFDFGVQQRVVATGNILKDAQWTYFATPGEVSADLAVSISPFHASLNAVSTSAVGSPSTVSCGGVDYPTGVGVSGAFDAVTP